MNPKADPNDYPYDISIEDLRRYKTLSPIVILQWLQDAQEFDVSVVKPDLKKYRHEQSERLKNVETIDQMITFEKLESKLQNQAKRLRDEFGVASLAVFGSVARGDTRTDSDVDFLVQFDGRATFDRYMNLKLFLEDLLCCPVDLVTKDGVRAETRSFIEGDARRVA